MDEIRSGSGAVEPRRPDPVVRRIGVHDVVEAFVAGLRDFQGRRCSGCSSAGSMRWAGSPS